MNELCCEFWPVRCIWLHVIIMSRTSFRVNLHSIVCLNAKELLARSRRHIWILSNSNEIRSNNLLRSRSSSRFRQTIEWGFTLTLVRDIITTCSQMHRTDQNSQHSSVIWPVWLNPWVFGYKVSGCGLKCRFCHLDNVLPSFKEVHLLKSPDSSPLPPIPIKFFSSFDKYIMINLLAFSF